MKLSRGLVIVIAILGSFLFSEQTSATTNQLVFTPKVNQTAGKIDDSQTDIKLKVTPGKTSYLSVDITNESDEKQTLSAGIFNAKTNTQGVINYTSQAFNLKNDMSLSKLVDYSEKIILKAKEKKEIRIAFAVPKQPFSGIIMGGLMIQQEPKESNDMIKNAFSFSIPIILIESETKLDAGLSFNEVKPELTGGKNAVKITLDNPVNNVLSEATYAVEITKKDSDKMIYEGKLDQVNFAPNMSFDYFILMGKDKYKAGEYTAHIKVTSPYGDWKWDEDFNIESQIAKKLNKESISVEKMDITMKILIAVIILLVIIIIYILYRFKNNKSHVDIEIK